VPRPDANDLQIKSETILVYEPREHSRCEHILKLNWLKKQHWKKNTVDGSIRLAEIDWKNKPKLNCCERTTLFRLKKEAEQAGF